jgi:hypothetical protein
MFRKIEMPSALVSSRAPEDGSTTILRNVCENLPIHTATHHRILAYSVGPSVRSLCAMYFKFLLFFLMDLQ